MRKIGIGIAGCGASVWMHGPAIETSEDVELVAWMDVDFEASKKAASRFGGLVYSDYDKFLECRGLDAVIVATPNCMHSVQVPAALAMKKHVLCEKPMGRTIAECKEMLDRQRDTSKVLMVGFMKRFDPSFIMVHDVIRSGEIGEVYEVYCDWGWPQYFMAGPRDLIQNGGGLLIDHGCHSIDLARWWAGDIESVYANVNIALYGREVDDYSCVICRHNTGSVSIHEHSRLTHRHLHESYRIEGTKGCITMDCGMQWSARLEYPFTVMLHKRTRGIASTCSNITPQPVGDVMEQVRNEFSYSKQLHYFISCIKNDSQPERCNGKDGYAAVEAINAAYISACEERNVQLPIAGDYEYEKTFRTLLSKQKIRITAE